MKILHIIPSVSPIRGGPSQAVIQMVYALRSLDIDSEIATTNDSGADLLDVPLHKLIEYQQVPTWFFYRFSSTNTSIREFAFSNAFAFWLWTNACQYDLWHIHAIFSYPSTIAMAIARIKKIPYIIRPLGQLCYWSLQQSQRRKQVYLQLIERANLNHAQALHFTSEIEYRECYPLKLKAPGLVISHGLQVPPSKINAHIHLRQWLQLPNNEPIILFLSRLHPKKGLETLIASLTYVYNQRFTFVIAGSGDPEYEAKIHQCVAKSGISDRTHFLGFVEGETKNLLLQGSDLFALTSHSENFGIVVLEALAAGLPALVTPGVALSQLVHQHQFGYVPPLEETAISNALLHYLQNPEGAKQMGERARKFIQENYTWDKVATDLIDVYQSILANQPLPTRLQSTATI